MGHDHIADPSRCEVNPWRSGVAFILMRTSLMIANGLIVASALVWLLTVIVAFSQSYRAAPIPVVTEHVDTVASTAEFRRGWYGFVLRLDGVHDVMQFKQAIDEIVGMNASSVLLETPLFEEGPESVEVASEAVLCPSLTDLVSIIDYANERGLGVVLVPTIVFAEVRASQDRSRFAPADWDRWWASYEQQILRLADLAQATRVEVFSVGSELSESEIMASQWTDLLTQARSRYTGLLMYNSQWERATRIAFWEYVDVIGVSAWFPLVRSKDQSEASLEAQWDKALREIDRLATGAQRPILLTAVGYPSLSTGIEQPWEATPRSDLVADEKSQAAGLSAFLTRFEAVDPLYPRHAGFFVYRWGASNDVNTDRISHVIEGKQAETIVREALGRLKQRNR